MIVQGLVLSSSAGVRRLPQHLHGQGAWGPGAQIARMEAAQNRLFHVLRLPTGPSLLYGASKADFDHSSTDLHYFNHYILSWSFFFLRLNIFTSFTCSLTDIIYRHLIIITVFQHLDFQVL